MNVESINVITMYNNYCGNQMQGSWRNYNHNNNNNFQTLDQTFSPGYRKKYARPPSETGHMSYSNRGGGGGGGGGYSQRPWHSRNQRGNRQNLYLNDVYHGVNNNYKYYDGGGKRYDSAAPSSRRPISHRPYNSFHSFRGNRHWRPDRAPMMNDYRNMSEDYNPEEFQPIDVQSLSPTDTSVEFPEEEFVESPNEDQMDELALEIPCCAGVKVEESEIQGISKNIKLEEEDNNNVADVQCTPIRVQTENAKDDSQEAVLKVAEPDKSYLRTAGSADKSVEVREIKHIIIEEILVEEKTITRMDREYKTMPEETVQIKTEIIDETPLVYSSSRMSDRTDGNDSIYDLYIDEDRIDDRTDEYIDLMCDYQEDVERMFTDEESELKNEDLSNLIYEEQVIIKTEKSSSSFGLESDKQLLDANNHSVKEEMREVDPEMSVNEIEQVLMRKWNLLYVESMPPTFSQYVFLLQEEVENLKGLYSQLAPTLKNLQMNYLPFAGFVELRRSFNRYPIISTVISNMFNEYIKEQKLRTQSDFSLLEQVEKRHNLNRAKSNSVQNLSAMLAAAPVINFEVNDSLNDNYQLVEIDLQVSKQKRLRRNSTGSVSKKSNYTEDATYIYFNEYAERAKCKEKSIDLSKVDVIYANILDPRIRRSMYPERSRKTTRVVVVDDSTKLVRETDDIKRKFLDIFGDDADLLQDGSAEKDTETDDNRKSKKCSKQRSEEITSTTADDDAIKEIKKKKKRNAENSAYNRVLKKVNKQKFIDEIGSATEDDDVKKCKKRNKENEDVKGQQSNQQIPKKVSKRKNSEEADCTIIKKRNKESKHVGKHRHSTSKKESGEHNAKSRRHSCDYRNSPDEKSQRGERKRKISTDDDDKSSIVEKKSEENVKYTKSEVSPNKKFNDMPLLNVTISDSSIEELFPTQNNSDMLSLSIIDERTQSETTYIDLVSPATSIVFHMEEEESVATLEKQVKSENQTEEEQSSSGIEIEIACNLEVDSSKDKVLESIVVENDDTVISIESTNSESSTELLKEKNELSNATIDSVIEPRVSVNSREIPATSSIENAMKTTSTNSSVITFASLNYIPQNRTEQVVHQNTLNEDSNLQKLCSTKNSFHKKQNSYRRKALVAQQQYLSGKIMVNASTTSSANTSLQTGGMINSDNATSIANMNNIAETHRIQTVVNVPGGGGLIYSVDMSGKNLNNVAETQRLQDFLNAPGGGIFNTVATTVNPNLQKMQNQVKELEEPKRMQTVVTATTTTTTTSSANIVEMQRGQTSMNNQAIRLVSMPLYQYKRTAETKAVFSARPVMSQLMTSCSSGSSSSSSKSLVAQQPQQQRKVNVSKMNMSEFVEKFLSYYCLFVNQVKMKVTLQKSDVECEMQAAHIQNMVIRRMICELQRIIDSCHVEEFSINALIEEISKLGDLYFFLTVFVTNAKRTRTDFGRILIDQMNCTTKLFETLDFVGYSTAKFLLSPMSYDQRISLYAQVVKYRSLCILNSPQMDQRPNRTVRIDSIVKEDMYLCVCGKIAIIACKCKRVVYCSIDCKIKNLNEHKRSCIG
ncbi:PREDICTED: uncharacterized protein LOC108567473 isoform X2 [Nicrophorus vespilloides]|uniref:Uncharacterized protein LOC108567473 isoform X2 n=1 Tax=Nicrophorus vespilloides TaxID=110193 RepID=A0ABM1N9G4_NICVS|nr:PREDICTED: uncharacterized protein LOC108567473 isoform X2 [Nicrophorus vespilloides]